MENLYLRLAPALVAILELVLMSGAALLIVRSRQRPARDQAAPSFQLVSFHSLERAFSRLARRRGLAAFAVGASVIVVRTALIPVLGIPQPRWNDEFSYLLAADTFAHGRLTNPSHPMWIHFETFHIIEHPTYMSMYPPAQGLVLAVGQLLGHPWIGQLLITAAMCAALCWMLQGWMPPQWALFGAVLAALRLGILSYWMNTYWCASVAALGGALVLGAWPRLRKHPSVGMSLILAAGLVILANSRPYEGFVFAIPIALAMLVWLGGAKRPSARESAWRVVFPIVVVLAAGGLATGYYYFRVTGSPFVMAYQVNRGQYAMAPYFIWQTPRPEPVYHHAVMRDYYRWELGEFERNRTLKGYVERGADKVWGWWQFYLGPLLTVPALALPWAVRSRKMRLPLVACGAMAAGFAVQTWTFPHYFSPATGAFYILLVQGLRHVRLWRRHTGNTGLAVVRAVFLVACAMIVLRVMAAATHTHIEPDWPRGNLERAAVQNELRRLRGDQLVFVRYGNHHDVDREWVWNKASIDTAKVVWARDMGESQNQELFNYFPYRRTWSIDGDDPHPKLEPYVVWPEATRPLP
jgi:hypothetical protein